MVDQAYRYPKSSWPAAQARAHCSRHNGSFEAATGAEKAEKELPPDFLLPEHTNRVNASDDYKPSLADNDTPTTFFFLTPTPATPMIELAAAVKQLAGKWMITCEDNEKNNTLFSNWAHVGKHENELVVTNYPASEPAEKEEPLTLHMDFTTKEEAEKIVGGIVYPARKVDGQGEWATKESIREAMHFFMEQGRLFNVGHEGSDINITILENFQAEKDTMKGGGIVKEGDWYMAVRVNDENIWEMVTSGELKGFSWEGLKHRQMNVSP